jgi:hypothetical protein
MVIRPILMYGSMLWWPRVTYNVSRMEFNQLQRLPCLAITGMMRMTPPAAVEVLLALPPLHAIIKAEAQAGVCRLICNDQWNPKSTNYGHIKKSWDLEHECIFTYGDR